MTNNEHGTNKSIISETIEMPEIKEVEISETKTLNQRTKRTYKKSGSKKNEHNQEQNGSDITKTNNDMKLVDATAAKHNIGIVTECIKLNIRKEPDLRSKIITTIPFNSKILIEREEGEWFYVDIGNDIKGYCMKAFVEVPNEDSNE